MVKEMVAFNRNELQPFGGGTILSSEFMFNSMSLPVVSDCSQKLIQNKVLLSNDNYLHLESVVPICIFII